MELEERVGKLENRTTKLETELPHLKEVLDRNTSCYEKLVETMGNLGETLHEVSLTMAAQNMKIEQTKEETEANAHRIEQVNSKVDAIAEKGKFDIWGFLKTKFPWIVIGVGIVGYLVSTYVKF